MNAMKQPTSCVLLQSSAVCAKHCRPPKDSVVPLLTIVRLFVHLSTVYRRTFREVLSHYAHLNYCCAVHCCSAYDSYYYYYLTWLLCVNLSNGFTIHAFQFDDFCQLCFTDYLLSNNHVNSIIVHKFDFSDEEVILICMLLCKPQS